MCSRFVSVEHTDFCYNPVRISKNGRVFYVPCGKCNGCLLQKCNSMSFRLGDEIENSSNSIFFTLTYSNKYVPKLECRVEDGQYHWFSAPNNIRFDGKRDKLRDLVDFYSPFCLNAPLHNYPDKRVIGYLSKSDIQLYLKLLRKSIYDNFRITSGSFRYYIIGEYGPGKKSDKGKYRPHFHGVIVPCNEEIASYLLRSGLFENWKMCDESLFKQYTKFCDSGTRHYVTEYVTGVTYLPSLLRETKEIKPFALYSRQNGTIGVGHFDRKKVSKDIERGVDQYSKRVTRIERNYIFQYPSQITNALFPKCSRFSLLSFDGLLRIYEYLFNIRQVGFDVATIFNDVSEFSAQDLQASRACLQVCDEMNWSPYHYVEVLVDFYYRKAMQALRYQYEWQESHISDPYRCVVWYYNWKDFLKDADFNRDIYPLQLCRVSDSRAWFLMSFGITHFNFDYGEFTASLDDSLYRKDVDSIIESADKSKKVNVLCGLDPHIV